MLNFCTLFDHNYIAQGLSLCESIATNHKCAHHIHVLAFCQKSLSALKRLALPDVTLVSVSEIETDAVRKLRSRVSHAEYAWMLKSNFILRVLRDADHTMYVDADSYFFNTAQIILDCIGDAPLALTPHRFAPAHRRFIRNGKFNAGFIYARRCEQAIDCLKSWGRRCVSKRRGPMTDQLHLNTWPSEYGARIIDHRGINLAPWNQEQYTYSVNRGVFSVDTHPLVFYHFHQGLTPAYPMHKFLQMHLYPIYRDALKSARERVR